VPTLIARSISGQECVGAPRGKAHMLSLFGGFGIALAGILCSGSRFGLVCIAAMLLLSVFLAMQRGRARA
jgi:hypothetical protein